jgi:hypothetical protein
MIHTLADEFAAEIAQLCATPVSTDQWDRFLELHVPSIEAKTGLPVTGRARSRSDKKRDVLKRLYAHDQRVAPWAGTAHGVLQAVNTYEHHEGTIRGADRAECNMLRIVTGEFANLDRSAWATLSTVLA